MKILNFGSLNVDNVYQVDHFVRDGETISTHSLKFYPGGKGLNQTIAIARAGGEVYHAGAIGINDGELLEDCLKKEKVNIENLMKVNEPSGHAIIQVNSKGQNAIIVYPGSNYCLSKEFIDSTLNKFDRDDFVLLQNEINNVDYIMERAHASGIKIIFNPSPITEKINSYPLHLVDIFILNEIEGAIISGEKEENKILDKLADTYPDAIIVLTLGEKGSCYKYKNEYEKFSIYKNNVIDTTAAGDTYCGYLIAGLAKKMNISEAIKLAGAASSISVSRAGASTSIPYFSEVQQFLSEYNNIK